MTNHDDDDDEHITDELGSISVVATSQAQNQRVTNIYHLAQTILSEVSSSPGNIKQVEALAQKIIAMLITPETSRIVAVATVATVMSTVAAATAHIKPPHQLPATAEFIAAMSLVSQHLARDDAATLNAAVPTDYARAN